MRDGTTSVPDETAASGMAGVHASASTLAETLAETLIDVVQARASTLANRTAYTFVTADGHHQERSYEAIARRGKAIGAALQRLIDTGDRVLLLYPPGLGYVEAFFGSLLAGAVAVPAYPPLPNRLDQRLQAVIADAAPRVVLVPSEIMAFQAMLQAAYPALRNVEWLASDLIGDSLASAWQAPDVGRETPAFLQYTSGSTGTPRGVKVSHANLLHNFELIRDCFGCTPDDHVVLWLPPYHDMGLIGGILAPLHIGFSATLISPLTFLQKPLVWLQILSEKKATLGGGPNFAYDLCVRKLTREQLETLDLRHWRVAFNGAEPVRASTMERFQSTFGPRGFRAETFLPCYGLAEATLLVTGCPRDEAPKTITVDSATLREHRVVLSEDGQTLVSSGVITGAQEVLLVNPEERTPCPDGQVGEIWVKGGSVSEGYWNQPEASTAVFAATLADGRGPYLRTGDLGFAWQRQLYVTGRIKDLIIVDGRNHYPQDLEATIEQAHSTLRAGRCVAFAVERDDGESVVVVAELQDPAEADAAAQAIRRAIQSQHALGLGDLVWVRAGEIPKTSSGKLRRRECRARYLEGKLQLL